MNKLYLTNIMPLLQTDLFEAALPFVPKERQMAMEKLRFPEDRARSLAAGLLLEYGLREQGFTLLEAAGERKQLFLTRTEYGKPMLSGEKSIFFNLTHSGKMAAVVLDEADVGVDLEKVRKRESHENSRKIAKRFFCEEETAFLDKIGALEGDDAYETAFGRIWTRKESYVKAVGKGMRIPFDSFCVLEETDRENQFFWNTHLILDELCKPEYALSVCSRKKEISEPVRVDLTDVVKMIIIKSCEGGEIHV